MPKSKKSTEYLFVLSGINTEKIDLKYNLSNTEKVIPLNTTRIIDLEPEVPEIISFLDETKKIHKCQVSMIDFNSGKNISKLQYNCYWCRNPFTTAPIGCPIKYISSQAVKQYFSEISRDKYIIKENINLDRKNIIDGDKRIDIEEKEYYETDGVFCSFNCCCAYIKDNKHNLLYAHSEVLLTEIYNQIFGNDIKKIEQAPHWRLIDKYGGHLTIEDFRESFNKVEYESHGISRTFKKNLFKSIGMLYEEHIKL
jgi:hypothetical protein